MQSSFRETICISMTQKYVHPIAGLENSSLKNCLMQTAKQMDYCLQFLKHFSHISSCCKSIHYT